MDAGLAPAWRFWLHRIGWGLLLGATIATLEFLYYAPLVSDPDRFGAWSIASLLMAWCGEGVLLVVTLGMVERWVRPREPGPWHYAIAVAIGAVGGALVWQAFVQFVVRDRLGIAVSRDHIGVPLVWMAGLLYHVWMMLFFGGLGVAVHASERGRARMLSALRTAEMARATSQRRLADMRLTALRTQVDPDLMIRTLAKIERLYEAEPVAAEQALDELIVYLRKALAELRRSAEPAGRDGHPASTHRPFPQSGFITRRSA